ncbi:MAG: peptidoglycan DD-metalloendopeptidase family protein, partial [Nitrospiraceae bacterium]|nr:peptidoglycan DD-metalloendopeptidase family protein [Nitrospiraceae bacterium]
LIPHDRGNTQTLSLSAYQLWLVVMLLVVLSFTSAFFFSRHRVITRKVAQLQQMKRDLEFQFASQTADLNQQPLPTQERAEIENRIRAEYEASVAAITAELSELYDMESQARSLTGLAPRDATREAPNFALSGGKGGDSSELGDIAYEHGGMIVSPPDVIYGLSQPSADLIIQEINIRTESLAALVGDLEIRADQIARIPSIIPATSRRWRISSRFGYRKDPFTLRVRHHSGLDISGSTGSPVVATARGTVTFAGRDGALGYVVRLDHGNGIETVYAHLKKCRAKAGDKVERKDIIGELGSSGRTTGPHIHYEVRVNGKPVDPSKYYQD